MTWHELNDDYPMPKNGAELLVCNLNQCGTLTLVHWDVVHQYWMSKGEPILSMQATHWCWISKPTKPMDPPEGNLPDGFEYTGKIEVPVEGDLYQVNKTEGEACGVVIVSAGCPHMFRYNGRRRIVRKVGS